MSRLRIGKVLLRRTEPRIIAPFTDRTLESTLRSGVRRGLTLLEARIDLFDEVEPEHVLDNVRRARAIAPVLATVRSSSEGGAWKKSERDRLLLYRALVKEVDALDVELDSRIRGAVVRAARKTGRTVVLSHHDFRTTPSTARLDAIVRRGTKAGADVVKIATFVRGPADVRRLTRLLASHPKNPLVVIGMGARGRPTRVLFPALGSLFTFASLDKKTAPGQLGLAETVRGLEERLGSAQFPARNSRSSRL
jgi:3-dehydroquinate dehydratase type I